MLIPLRIQGSFAAVQSATQRNLNQGAVRAPQHTACIASSDLLKTVCSPQPKNNFLKINSLSTLICLFSSKPEVVFQSSDALYLLRLKPEQLNKRSQFFRRLLLLDESEIVNQRSESGHL